MCQKRFLFNDFYRFLFFHKNAFFTFLFLGSTFFTSVSETIMSSICDSGPPLPGWQGPPLPGAKFAYRGLLTEFRASSGNLKCA